MLFCFICEGFPICSFVVSVGLPVASRVGSSFSSDDYREVVRSKGFDHSPGRCRGKVRETEGDIWR